jgi:hypothetical protein
MHKCNCCKNEVYAVDEDGLCFSCACIQDCAAIIEDDAELEANGSVDLAVELLRLVQLRILERLVDTGAPVPNFVADIKLAMARENPEH